MYKVFINDKPVIFSPEDAPALSAKNIITVQAVSAEAMMDGFERFVKSDDCEALVFKGSCNPGELFAEFAAQHRCMDAAGGIVRNREHKRLYIYRFGKWDLPKGKIEKNETPEMAALREVREETGLTVHKTVAELPSSYHMYDHKGIRILKRNYWYVMEYQGDEIPVPQTEESITEARWFGKNEMETIIHNTYASLLDVIEADSLYTGNTV